MYPFHRSHRWKIDIFLTLVVNYAFVTMLLSEVFNKCARTSISYIQLLSG